MPELRPEEEPCRELQGGAGAGAGAAGASVGGNGADLELAPGSTEVPSPSPAFWKQERGAGQPGGRATLFLSIWTSRFHPREFCEGSRGQTREWGWGLKVGKAFEGGDVQARLRAASCVLGMIQKHGEGCDAGERMDGSELLERCQAACPFCRGGRQAPSTCVFGAQYWVCFREP